MLKVPWGTSRCSWTKIARAGRCTLLTCLTIYGALKLKGLFQERRTRSGSWLLTTKATVRTALRPRQSLLALLVSLNSLSLCTVLSNITNMLVSSWHNLFREQFRVSGCDLSVAFVLRYTEESHWQVSWTCITRISHSEMLLPLFQNESCCKTFDIEMNFSRAFIVLQIKLISIWKVMQQDSFKTEVIKQLWNDVLYVVLLICPKCRACVCG